MLDIAIILGCSTGAAAVGLTVGRLLWHRPTVYCSENYCNGRADPRCEGDNCTSHCKMYCHPRCK